MTQPNIKLQMRRKWPWFTRSLTWAITRQLRYTSELQSWITLLTNKGSWNSTRETSKSAGHRKDLYDRKSQRPICKVDDLVYIKVRAVTRGMSKKLFTKWEGPFHVIEKLFDVMYRVKNAGTGMRKVFHVNRMRRMSAGKTQILKLADNLYKCSQDVGYPFSFKTPHFAPREPAENQEPTVGYLGKELIAPGFSEEFELTRRMATSVQQTMPSVSSVELNAWRSCQWRPRNILECPIL